MWAGTDTPGFSASSTSRLDGASGTTHILQLDAPKGSLGPALGVQFFLYGHPVFYHFVKCG
jgi:hypothetical protein